jgi:hypothetical protein
MDKYGSFRIINPARIRKNTINQRQHGTKTQPTKNWLGGVPESMISKQIFFEHIGFRLTKKCLDILKNIRNSSHVSSILNMIGLIHPRLFTNIY